MVLLAVALVLLQWPMRHVVESGDLAAATRLGASPGVPPCVVPARMSLLVDAFFIYVYLLAAWRVRCFVAIRRPGDQMVATLGIVGAGLVFVAGLLDVVEDVILWQRFGAGALAPGRCPSLDVGMLTPVMVAFWVAGVVALVVALLATFTSVRRRLGLADAGSVPAAENHGVDDGSGAGDAGHNGGEAAHNGGEPDRDGQIICCSGGGIRSAAFSLGALQVLTEKGDYQKASAVIGVSGGGYIAAAFHTLRRSLTGRTGEALPYAIGTPELARLRRQTHYLLPSIAVGARAIMALLYGVVVNLVLIGVALRAVAWLLGWVVADSGIVGGLGERRAYVDFAHLPLWYWLAALGPLAVVVVLFLAEVVVDRFRVPPMWLRTEGRALGQMLTIPGFVSAGLLLGIPAVLVWVNNLGQEAPTGLTGGLAAGLAGTAQHVTGTGPVSASAVLDSQFGFTTLAALGAAFIALARSAWRGMESIGGSTADGLRARLLDWVRTKLVPWLGSVLLLVGALVVLLRWTAGYAASEEWRSRWWVAALCAGLVLVISVFTDATRTSLHPYYRERLAVAYLARRTRDNTAEEYDYARPMPYSEWAAASDGGPRLVIVTSANAFDPEFVPPDRGCVPFVFDPVRTGVAGDLTLPSHGLVPTAAYERRADYRRRDVTVPGAVAISGAAFSPLTGRDNARTRPMRLLFAVVNARLGVWLPNPYWGTTSSSGAFADRVRDRVSARGRAGSGSRPERSVLGALAGVWAHLVSVADKPGAYRLFKEAFGRTSLYDRRLYVTDGGHYDNLGLVEALRRRPKRIIVIDASNDLEDTFMAVGSATATARMDLGVSVNLDLRRLQRHDGPRIGRGWTRGNAVYPDGSTTEILFVKAVLAGVLPWDVEAYSSDYPEFPRRSTGDQLYGEFDFEAYRALGYALTLDMIEHREARSPAVPAGEPTSERVTETPVEPAATGGPA
ncbi:patatin-like phospholipase family protein [Actinopolymorpha alba]|uniref:patatin-like phospholipase family protein n=1 Tax=Actinopolymorpha alba TaxID=533267 RepID=UPI0012F68B89|nr:patatin-like phospholipase family protein [Actinopolymorpha alba]